MCLLQGTGQLPSTFWLGLTFKEDSMMWFFEDGCEWLHGLEAHCVTAFIIMACTLPGHLLQKAQHFDTASLYVYGCQDMYSGCIGVAVISGYGRV